MVTLIVIGISIVVWKITYQKQGKSFWWVLGRAVMIVIGIQLLLIMLLSS